MYCLGDVVQQKVLTVSRKSERLVNLTIALLATKRWLTKSQIFSSIDGYEGEPDAMERMFERDKDDLRNLGIIIEVGSFDPLFEDEVGYRIRPESYASDIASISPRELSLISLASQAWKGAVLGSTALAALVKLKSLGVDSDLDAISTFIPRATISDGNFSVIIDGIAQKQVISFSYLSNELESQSRAIEPYGVGTKNGYWYVAGRDLDRKELRIFRLDRIDSEIKTQGKTSSYEIPDSFLMEKLLASPDQTFEATVRVRRDKAHALRARATSVIDEEEWSRLTISYRNEDELVSDVLWHGPDAVIESPKSARDTAVNALQELVRNHG